jgi:hypothetical protein
VSGAGGNQSRENACASPDDEDPSPRDGLFSGLPETRKSAIHIRRRTIGACRAAVFFYQTADSLQRLALFREGRGMKILNSGFSELTPEELADKVAFIIAQLTGNPNFATTNPTLAVISAQLALLNNAIAMAPGEARDAAIEAARGPLEQMMQNLASNLEQTANGNMAALATTGFELRKAGARTGDAPDAPQNLRLRNLETSGDVQFLFDAVGRAKAYQFQTSYDPVNGPWQDYDPVSSSRKVIAHGLQRAKDVWGRVRAIGPNNTKSAWSDPATTLVT